MPHIMIGAKKGWLARLNHAPLNSNYRKEWGRISATLQREIAEHCSRYDDSMENSAADTLHTESN